MKNFVMKTFLYLCGFVFFAEGALLFMLRYGRHSVRTISKLYLSLVQTTQALDAVLWCAIVFTGVGIIMLFSALRISWQVRFISIKDDGVVTKVPIDAVRDFIKQILTMFDEETTSMSDFKITVSKKGKWIYINVFATLTAAQSIRQEIKRIEQTLQEQIEKVFEFPHLKIRFQIRGIDINRHTANIPPQEDLPQGEDQAQELNKDTYQEKIPEVSIENIEEIETPQEDAQERPADKKEFLSFLK